jgi:parvulin-like peptidyl-prolyl isomerase
MSAWLALLALCLIGAGCSGDGETVIAEVNGSKLTLQDLYAEIPEDYFDSVTGEQRSQFIERWINAEILYQEAIRRGLQRESSIREKIRSAEKNILIADLINRELLTRVKVSDEEARNFFQAHIEEFTRKSEEIRASQILVPTLEEANRIRTQISEGADFAQLARDHSVDPSAMQGGDLGYFSKEDVLSEVAKAVFSTPPGTLTKPIKTEFGYHILLVTGVEPAGSVRDFELVRGEILAKLSRDKEHQELELFLQELRDNSSIKQADDVLSVSFPPGLKDTLLHETPLLTREN